MINIRLNETPNPIFVYDKNWVLESVNKAAAGMLGYSNPNDMVGKHIHDILDLKDLPDISEIQRLAKSGKQYHPWKELCHLNINGDCVDTLAHFSIIHRGKSGTEIKVIESCMPTYNTFLHLKQQINTLQNNKTLAENVPGLELTMIDSNYTILSNVGSELQKQGLAGPEPDGKNLLEYYDGEIVNILRPLLKIAFESTPVSREFKIGNQYYSVRLIPLITDTAEITSIIVFQNITETKLIEQKLKHSKKEAENANEARGNFIAKMSHEIRTPLNAVIGFSEQLAKTRLNKKQTHFVEVVRNSSKHLLSIIDEILVISKIDSEEIQIDEEPFAIPDVLKAVKDVVEFKYREKNLEYQVAVDLALTSLVLLGDAAKLRQVLINLVNNAIKFTHQGSVNLKCMVVRETTTSVTIEFEIRDTGIGISKQNIQKIFKPFHQVDESIGRSYSGTGLGLTISKEIIEKQGGRLKVKSKEDDGSVFSFTLRFKKSSDKSPADLVRQSSGKLLPENVRVLFVDDDPVNRMLGKVILKELSVNTDFAASGHEALEMFKPGKYHVILLDINMPGFSGVEVATRIRQIENDKPDGTNVKILAMTANVFKQHIRRYMDAGMDDVMLKPFSEDTIREKLRKHSRTAVKQKKAKIRKSENQAKKQYDLQQLERITKGDTGFMTDMLDAFLDNSENLKSRMEDALKKEDYPDIGEAAHRLLPSVEQMGMEKVLKLLRKVEKKYLRQDSWQPDHNLVGQAIQQLASGMSEIRDARNNLLNQKSG